ncbi:FtsQ-type POTRA domain-containing protein [Syntrophotalea acetylenica]|jgi:cell division protein FtsQ|uniref:cell division protein FtsQ/DivIB n=1 Tax=Syntrophotalea TaxID=2812025 RepID=UPI002A363E35|nr:FtsQ-type POTRA domain-containing protein [Syntrophotalea acetylenica]MDY0262619.1 FtsQ-type POTRA domain-containing protein [Syntrophotalea acetylenica]
MVNMAPPKQRRSKGKGNHFRKPRRVVPWRRLLTGGLLIVLTLASAALVVAGARFAGQTLSSSDFFRIENIRVENNRRIPGKQILALSDVRAGANIFELDLQRIGRRIEQNPWIAEARVRRMFPDQLVIRVEERTPKAIVRLDYLYYVDASGQIFKRLERGDGLNFPVISGIERQALLEHRDATLQRLNEAIRLLEELEHRKVFRPADVSELKLDDTCGITLYTCKGGVPVRLGHDGFSAKLDRLEKIFPQLATRLGIIDYIDLNVARRVIVKLETGEARGKG